MIVVSLLSHLRVYRQNGMKKAFIHPQNKGFGSTVVFTMAKTAHKQGLPTHLSPFSAAHEQEPPHAKERTPPHPYSPLSVSHEQTIHTETLLFLFNLIEVT